MAVASTSHHHNTPTGQRFINIRVQQLKGDDVMMVCKYRPFMVLKVTKIMPKP